MGDDANTIVHTATWSTAGHWLPCLAAGSVAAIWHSRAQLASRGTGPRRRRRLTCGFGSPGRNRTYVACPDSKSGGPCQQTNRGTPPKGTAARVANGHSRHRPARTPSLPDQNPRPRRLRCRKLRQRRGRRHVHRGARYTHAWHRHRKRAFTHGSLEPQRPPAGRARQRKRPRASVAAATGVVAGSGVVLALAWCWLWRGAGSGVVLALVWCWLWCGLQTCWTPQCPGQRREAA